MGTCYLIDFENVRENGIYGIKELSGEDIVVIFYTDNAKTCSLDIFSENKEVRIDAIKAPTGNQSLDIHLMSYLGYIIKKYGNEMQYCIVSLDRGYDRIFPFWKDYENVSVTRRAQISVVPPLAETKKSTRLSVKGSASKLKRKAMPQKTENPEETLSAKPQRPVKTENTEQVAPGKLKKREIPKKIQLNTDLFKALKENKPAYNSDVFGFIGKTASAYYGKPDFAENVTQEIAKRFPEESANIIRLIAGVLDNYDEHTEEHTVEESALGAVPFEAATTEPDVSDSADSDTEHNTEAVGETGQQEEKKPDKKKSDKKKSEKKKSAKRAKKKADEEKTKTDDDSGESVQKLRQEITDIISDSEFAGADIDRIMTIISENKNHNRAKQKIYLALMASFGHDRGLKMYGLIKPNVARFL